MFIAMTALELNQEIYKSLGIIADDENLLKRAANYLKKLAANKVEEEEKVGDITKTAGYREAMKDVEEGRVYHADSVNDMFHDILG